MSAFPLILLQALIAVESGGNDRALGDYDKHGDPQAFGRLQIHHAVIADVRSITGRWVSLSDAYDRRKAAEICVVYLSHYCTAERLGHEPTMEDYARCWNGGPSGYKKPATLPYWRKVDAALNKLSPAWLPVGGQPKPAIAPVLTIEPFEPPSGDRSSGRRLFP